MKKSSLYFCIAFVVFGALWGCSKEEIASSMITGTWRVSEVQVVLNEKIISIPEQVYESNYKEVQHAFNEDNTYVYTDSDGAKLDGTWEYLADTKEIVITYPSIEYSERFEVVTNTSSELILQTPTVDVEKASSDQDVETIFTATVLLLNTPSEEITPKTVGIRYKLVK